jgi:hypothetical protein
VEQAVVSDARRIFKDRANATVGAHERKSKDLESFWGWPVPAQDGKVVI